MKEAYMKNKLDFAKKLDIAYTNICKPLCHELNITQTAFDILMFLANNPEYKTARDIVDIRKIKANLVSVNVDKLVNEGFLTRESTADDRRKTLLICTPKAQPIIDRGHLLQENFFKELLGNISSEQKETFFKTLEIIDNNLDAIMK